MTVLLVYLASGAVVGILAGLLGLGGGVIIVPLLNMVFAWQGMSPDLIQHMALGTSLSTIVFTSISSFRAHHQRGSVRWDLWRTITPSIVLGTFGGSLLAGTLSTYFLKMFFAIFLFVIGTQMLLNLTPKATRPLPSKATIASVGGVIGLISSFAGVGGGTMSVPFMVWCKVPFIGAVGTSAAIGLPIALSGTLGYIVSGWGDPALPAWSLGYVSVSATLGLVVPSMLTAPLGVRLGHALPVKVLKRFFGLFIYVMAINMLIKLF